MMPEVRCAGTVGRVAPLEPFADLAERALREARRRADPVVARVEPPVKEALGRLLDKVVPPVVAAIVDRIDFDAVIDRIDLPSRAEYVIAEINLPEIIRQSSMSVGGEAVQGVRIRSIEADKAIERVVDKLLHRANGHPRSGAEPQPGAPEAT